MKVLAALALLLGLTACSEQEAVSNEIEFPGLSREGEFVLAASWQPAFCETAPRKPECESQTIERFDASHFSLHGLWPQPRGNTYCNVEAGIVEVDKRGDWRSLPKINLEASTRRSLEQLMPGTQSYLDRHEWIKHGTCYSNTDQQEYFQESIHLMNQLNNSSVQSLFEASIGEFVSREQIEDSFEDAFGVGAGERVELVCKQDGLRQIIVELRINLAGLINDQSELSTLIADAPKRSNRCSGGIADPAGLQ